MSSPQFSLRAIALLATFVTAAARAQDFEKEIRPLLGEFCQKCHSTEKQKGDLDLERFTSFEAVRKDAHVWQLVDEQIALGEMPPKDKPQPSPEQKARLVAWVQATLDGLARERAGDPGPVVLRRLSNAEFGYTVRDLTGVEALDPAREFPADGAAGEGFTNAGAALVMSPGLLTKYLDAAKGIAEHAVLLPDGIGFSANTSQRDWTEEKLAAIRAFYARHTERGGGQAVNLQGIQFDTNSGGRLPVEKYLAATLAERETLVAGQKSIPDVARERGLNGKYLATLWSALNDATPSLLLDPLRTRWHTAKPADATSIAAEIAQWQKALWRFTTVGHIGKRDGPKAWQVPVTPLASRQEVRLKLQAPKDGKDITLYLAASDAGDGNEGDFVVWENPRLVAPGRADLRLRDVRAAVNALTTQRERIASTTAQCLAAAAEGGESEALVKKHGVDPAVLAAWMEYLGIGGEARIDSYITGKTERAEAYDFIKGWTGKDALSVLANSSGQHVRIPGNMKPHSVAVHPSPKLRVAIGWRSPVTGSMRIEGVVQHAHPECGNGVTWSLELRRGGARQRLAAGVAQGGGEVKIGPVENVAVSAGDLVSVIIGPRDGNHSCDLTAVDFTVAGSGKSWNLAQETSPDILAGNPHADVLGNAGVWHFYSEPDGGAAVSVIPAGSLLAKWRSAPAEEKAKLAAEVQQLLLSGAAGLAKDAPDAILFKQFTSLSGPLVRASVKDANTATSEKDSAFGLDAALFGKHPNGTTLDAASLCVRAPSVIEVKLPADLVDGCEFVTTGTLHRETGAEGSVQLQVSTTKPAAAGLVAGAAKEVGSKAMWSDGERPIASEAPIIVTDSSAARRRIEAALDEFRQLFPAALCYTKIVPVDEVVTLTLFYREDDQLRRLMLDDAQTAELERLWSELHFVSHDALKLVDAFDQLWQFATQDGDPKVFEPMREPIKQRAAEFREQLVAAEPKQLDGVLEFAQRAWRRPLTDAEREELRALYRKLRTDELPHDAALRMTLARVFVAPAFLYKMERPAPGIAQAPVNDFELATRLSYFLWSSAPDAELSALAAAGTLREPATLAAQTRRMLRDARVRRLAVEFGTQWLHVRDFDKLDEKSERHFPTFAALRGAMAEEPVRFFTDIFQRDASVLSLLDADHTFVNAALAKHYGLTPNSDLRSPISDSDWQRVDGVRAQGRGGILAFAATLAKQSGASRTSPILRGNWLCETLLGERLPRPPKGVPVLPEEVPAGLTDRQLTEQHSSDPKCAGCHVRIDPFGFAFERYDAIGGLRAEADTRARLADGTEFDGLDGVRDYLLTKRRNAFVKQFTRKLLGYALGRSVQLSDKPLIDDITAQLSTNEPRIGRVVEMIVLSRQFREIRGREFADTFGG
jgi:PAS domain-containing protein